MERKTKSLVFGIRSSGGGPAGLSKLLKSGIGYSTSGLIDDNDVKVSLNTFPVEKKF